MQQKLAPEPFLILLNNQKQPLPARNYLKNKVFWKRIIKKSLRSFFFFSNPVPFNGQCYHKQKGSGTSHQSLFRTWNKFKKNSFFPDLLSDQVWWWNVKQILSYSKNYTCKFMQVNSWHHKLFHFHLSFWIWSVERKGKNHKNLNISRTKSAF